MIERPPASPETLATPNKIGRRLWMLTAAGAVGGALFAPFVLANPAAEAPPPAIVFAVFTVGAAVVTALAAWGGLRWADRAGLPMPMLRAWEQATPLRPDERRTSVVYPLAVGLVAGMAVAAVARVLGVPPNPGTLPVRVATAPFAAVVPEVSVHLFLMSGLVLLLKRVWLAVALSAVVFVVIFHGNPPQGMPAVTAFVVGMNFCLGLLTGWAYARWGFVAAMLTHAAAHVVVLGIN